MRGRTIEKTGSTSQPTSDIHLFLFHSARLIISLKPSNVTEMFPSSLSAPVPGQVLLTFYGFPSVLSAINGDLCEEGKAFDLPPQPEETRLSAFDFKSQIHVGLLFLMSSTHHARLYDLLCSLLWRCYLAMQIAQHIKYTWQWESLMDYCTNTESRVPSRALWEFNAF